MSELPQLLVDLLKIDSPTTNEKALTDYIQARLADYSGYKLTRKNNLLIYETHSADSKPYLALYGHLDTVPNQQTKPPYQDKDKIYGCGASDMKAGLAVMLKLLEDFSKLPAAFNLQFVFYDQEEGPFIKSGLKNAFIDFPFLKQADLAIVLEPTSNEIQTGCLGVINAEIIIRGKSGHSARPWQAKHPLDRALGLISKLNSFEPVKYQFDGLDFYEVLSITHLMSGKAKNIIPPHLEIWLNYRFNPSRSISDAVDFLKKLVPEDKNISLKIVDTSPAGQVVSKNSLLKKLVDKNSLKLRAKQAWTDVARLTLEGIPAVNFGPGDPSQAHQIDEYVYSSAMDENYAILLDFIKES